jgi:hypothetical protein
MVTTPQMNINEWSQVVGGVKSFVRYFGFHRSNLNFHLGEDR